MSKIWYGSVANRIAEHNSKEPAIGLGVTECGYTDRHPYEIIAIKDERHITVRELTYKRIDHNGMSECQEYEYYSDENNNTIELFKTKQGVWRERIGRGLGCNGFYIGKAERYFDYSF